MRLRLARYLGRTIVVLPIFLLGCGGGTSSPTAPSTPAYVIPSAELAEMLSEKVLGDPNAPVTIVEYSSPTCPHCVTFHVDTLPELKAKHIDAGRVKLVYRDFPVNGAALSSSTAYAAAALARCAGNARYFEALDILYTRHTTWVSIANSTSAMKQALAPMGMSSEKMDACVASADIRNEIDRLRVEAGSSYGVRGTPTFLIGGSRYEGALSLAQIEALIAPTQQLPAAAPKRPW